MKALFLNQLMRLNSSLSTDNKTAYNMPHIEELKKSEWYVSMSYFFAGTDLQNKAPKSAIRYYAQSYD